MAMLTAMRRWFRRRRRQTGSTAFRDSMDLTLDYLDYMEWIL